MIDMGVLVAPRYYSDLDAEKKEEEEAAALQAKHKERAEKVKAMKKDAKEMKPLDAIFGKAKATIKKTGMSSSQSSPPATPASASDDGESLLPVLPELPKWFKEYKAYRTGIHPLTDKFDATKIVTQMHQLSFYAGMINDKYQEYGRVANRLSNACAFVSTLALHHWRGIHDAYERHRFRQSLLSLRYVSEQGRVREGWIVNFPPSTPNDYELFRLRLVDHRPYFARLPWNPFSPLHLAIDPDTDLWLPPIPYERRESMGEGPTRAMRVRSRRRPCPIYFPPLLVCDQAVDHAPL